MMYEVYAESTLPTLVHGMNALGYDVSPTQLGLTRKSILAFAVFSTAISLGIHGSSVMVSDTARTYIEPLGWDQSLRGDRADLQLIARIRELGTYHDGWDGFGGAAPSRSAIEEAEAFTRTLPLDEIVLPHISLAADGEINFFWDKEGERIDLGFYGTGVYSYYIRLRGGAEYFGDDVALGDNIPEEILDTIKRKTQHDAV
jgi:hypothetical protein